jgi:predicted nucleotidyltransferase
LKVKTAAQLTKEEIESYRDALRRRQEHELQDLQRRKDRAWALARQAAVLLKEEFGASRVVVFGSLARDDLFTLWSDVDLAAWGLRSQDTFRAIGAVYDLDAVIPINLVDVNAARASLLETIRREGIEL